MLELDFPAISLKIVLVGFSEKFATWNEIFEILVVTPKQTALCAKDKILITSNLGF